MWRKGNACELLVGMSISAATMETVALNNIAVSQEIKSKTTMRYHLTSVRMAIIKKVYKQ